MMNKLSKGILKGTIGIVAMASMAIMMPDIAYADAAIYVGKDVSEDGTTLIGRSIDYIPGASERVYSVEGNTYNDGESIYSHEGNQFQNQYI